jgi:cytochrome c553
MKSARKTLFIMTVTFFIRPPVLLLCAFLAIGLLFVSRPGEAADIGETVKLCVTCHGEDGRPSEADMPVIWGQQFYYLYVQLKDYKSGRRQNEIMSSIVADLGREELKALAQYFSERNWPTNGFRATEANVAEAESAANSGMCVQCHLGGYEGNSGVPRLAGQQLGYLERTMLEFRDRVRLNSQAKVSLFATYNDADIQAMAHYLAGF